MFSLQKSTSASTPNGGFEYDVVFLRPMTVLEFCHAIENEPDVDAVSVEIRRSGRSVDTSMIQFESGRAVADPHHLTEKFGEELIYQAWANGSNGSFTFVVEL